MGINENFPYLKVPLAAVVKTSRVLVVLAFVALAGSCSCRQSSEGGGDIRVTDHSSFKDMLLDRYGPDAIPTDAAQERQVPDLDLRRDFGTIDPKVCGGTRKLVPKLVTPYKPKACGKGCKQITFGNQVELDYEVVGNLLVYIGYHWVTGIGLSGKVYYVELKTGKEWRLHDDIKSSYEHGCHLVSTDGKTIAHTCIRDGFSPPGVPVPKNLKWLNSITTWDPNTQIEKDHYCIKRYLVDDPCGPLGIGMGSPGIALTMSMTSCAKGDVQLFRYSDSSLKNVSQQYGSLGYMHMSGHRIVWARNYRIDVYDAKTSKTRKVDSTKSWQCHSRIDRDRVVWTDLRNSTYSCYNPKMADIYLHDLSTGKTRAVTTHQAQQTMPDVGGDWVVWQDYRNNPNPNPGDANPQVVDVYAKNIKTGKELQLSSGKGLNMYPRVDGDRVFYMMRDEKKRASLFMVDLKIRMAQ